MNIDEINISIKKLQSLKKETNDKIDSLIEDLRQIKYNNCSHMDADGKYTIEYCDPYEMRQRDMYCKQCGKNASYNELIKDSKKFISKKGE